MRNLFPFSPFWAFLPFRNADGAGGGGAAPATGAEGGAPPAGATPDAAAAPAAPAAAAAAAKWFEGDRFTAEEKTWLAARGMTGIEDPVEAATKLAKGHRMAEQRLGKGIDSIMDRPAKDQPLSDYMKANRDVFGLPETADGYKTEKPADWPKELPWNDDLDARAQALAFERGVPPELHKAYIGLVADYMKTTAADIDTQTQKAQSDMMVELTKDWGAQTQAKLTQARQAMNFAATEAGLSPEGVSAAMAALNEKTGDPAVMKMFAAIGAAMSEDSGIGLNKGGGLGITPVDARAQIQKMSNPGGEYYEAMQAVRDGKPGAQDQFKAIKAKVDTLSRVATGGAQ